MCILAMKNNSVLGVFAMATRKTGTAVIMAESGKVGKVVVPGCTSLTALKTFLTSIQSAYMDGFPVSVSWSETEKQDATLDGGNTDRRAIIVYNDNNTQTTKRISIPSWGTDAGDLTMTPEGERVPLVACQSVIAALETATGGSFTALEGYIIQGR